MVNVDNNKLKITFVFVEGIHFDALVDSFQASFERGNPSQQLPSLLYQVHGLLSTNEGLCPLLFCQRMSSMTSTDPHKHLRQHSIFFIKRLALNYTVLFIRKCSRMNVSLIPHFFGMMFAQIRTEI